MRHTVQKMKANLPTCGVSNVVDFIPGDVLESRRGGVDVLRHLAQELATLERNGSIQIIRNIPNVGERIGHLLIFDGTLAAAFHRGDKMRLGIEALLEIESDASTLDATMSLHEMAESTYINTLSQHPGARLVASYEAEKEEVWWATVRTPRRKIEREERLPELKPSVSVPEALRRRSEARLKNKEGAMLQRGQVWLEDSIEPDEAFHLARLMKEMNEPLLLLSRQSPPQMERHFKSVLEQYRWLSETEHEHTIEPTLESIRTTVDGFFAQNKRGVLFMEGIEYLSGIHGEQRVIEMVRSIADETRLNGNLFILTSNLEAFSQQQRARLERECTRLSEDQLKSWLLDVELLAEHPFFQTIDQEEEDALDKHLKDNTHDPVVALAQSVKQPISPPPAPVEQQSMKVDQELQSKMMEWAKESEEEQDVPEEEHATMEDQLERVLERKPRTPQRIVRRRKQRRPSVKRNPLDAAAKHEKTVPDLQIIDPSKGRRFVPSASNRKHAFPPGKPSHLQQAIDQAAVSTSRKKIAQFPPIKSTGHIPVAIAKPDKQPLNLKTSLHAREHATAKQRLSNDHDTEGDA